MSTDNLKVFEVYVSAVGGHKKEELMGVWRGAATSEMQAREFAEADVWQERFTRDGLSPSHAIREVPRYLVSDKWFHSFDGINEGIIRFAYDRATSAVLHGDALRQESGLWTPLTKGDTGHLAHALHEILDIDFNVDDFEGLKEVAELPAWATQGQATARRAKP